MKLESRHHAVLAFVLLIACVIGCLQIDRQFYVFDEDGCGENANIRVLPTATRLPQCPISRQVQRGRSNPDGGDV